MPAPGCSSEKHQALGTQGLQRDSGPEAVFALQEAQLAQLALLPVAASEALAAVPQAMTVQLTAPTWLPAATQSPPAAPSLLLAHPAATMDAPPGPLPVVPRAQLLSGTLRHRHSN